jgi:hypothetical protein
MCSHFLVVWVGRYWSLNSTLAFQAFYHLSHSASPMYSLTVSPRVLPAGAVAFEESLPVVGQRERMGRLEAGSHKA